MSLTIRPARPEELDAIWALVRLAVAHMNAGGNPQWGEDYPAREDYAGDLDRGELVAAVDDTGAILGVACINCAESPEYDPLPWTTRRPAMVIHRMAVDPACQGQGVGHAFFTYTEEKARRQQVPSLRIDTYGQNLRMQHLILSHGYHKVGEISLHSRPMGFPCFEKALI